MKKFLVLFLTPVALLDEWMKIDPAERKAVEDKMNVEWKTWTENNASSIVDAPAGAGKTKAVTLEGVSDTKNNIMMYAIVQAGSQDEAAALFAAHPHLQIPQASIEVMEINSLTGMN